MQGVMLVVCGFIWFRSAFKRLKLARKIQNIATSEISSAALGDHLELRAFPHVYKKVYSPLDDEECVAFILDLEVHRSSSDGSYWEQVSKIVSYPYLLISDKRDNLAAVEICACELLSDFHKREFTFDNSEYDRDSMPDSLRVILEGNDLVNFSSGFGLRSYRIIQRVFKETDRMYILGSSFSRETISHYRDKSNKERGLCDPVKWIFLDTDLLERIDPEVEVDEILQSPEGIQNTDINKDGYITHDERELLIEKLKAKKEVYISSNTKPSYYPEINFIVSNPKESNEFFSLENAYLSLAEEDVITRKLTVKASLGIIFGPIIILIGFLVIIVDLRLYEFFNL